MGHDDVIARLKEDLYFARTTVISLLPEPAQDAIHTYYQCETPTERYRWEHELIEAVIDLAVEVETEGLYTRSRAYCPLCNRGSSDAYTSGFTLPEGLKRHLTGWGNIQQCHVIKIATEVALEHWGRTRWQLSQDLHEERQRLEEQRRAVEPLYRIAPGRTVLRDEHVWSSPVRPDSRMAAVEARLSELGFTIERDGRVSSYTRRFGNDIVFADPRIAGRIDFRVFDAESPESRADRDADFYLLDSWKHDLESKLEERVRATRTR